MLPLTSSEPSFVQTDWGDAEEEPGNSDEYEDSERKPTYNLAQARNLQLVTGNGPVPTAPGNIGESSGGAAGPPNGV